MTDDFQPDREYLTNQRRRNLPTEESRQGPSGEPATGLAKHSGNWLLLDETEKAFATIVMTEKYGTRELCSHLPCGSEYGNSLRSGTEPGLRNSESRGRDLEREIVPFTFVNI